MIELRLSQNLLIRDHFTISIPGETESYFGVCSITGESEWLPRQECWYALTEESQKVWQGKFETSYGVVVGRVFMSEAS